MISISLVSAFNKDTGPLRVSSVVGLAVGRR